MTRVYLIFAGGIVAVSFASLFIRWADAPALVIAVYRLGLASVFLLPVAFSRWSRELSILTPRDIGYLALSGVFLSLHFALWITSLGFTTVASSVVLVTTSPLFVGLASQLLRLDRVSREMWLGILMAVAGGIAIGWGDWAATGQALWGDLLALGGAIMASGYLLAGRRLRQSLSNLTYISVVYSLAAALTFVLVLLSKESLSGYSPQTYLMFLLLALVPQVLGHSAFNWALGHLPAPFVSAGTLGEAVGATTLAFLLLGEAPSLLKLGGGALILLGVYFASRGLSSPKALLAEVSQ